MSKTVQSKEYFEDKRNFFEKHNYDYTVITSDMDEYGAYHKDYVFEDGTQWYERMSPEYIDYEVEVKLVNVKASVKMFRTEYWSSESSSKYYYEKF